MRAVQFANAWVLYLLWLVPAVGAWWYVVNQRGERKLSVFMSQQMQNKLCPAAFSTRFNWQTGLITSGLLLMLIAVARPQWGTKEEVVYGRGRDLVIALDVSRSMLATDVRPNRLQRAKVDLMDLLKDLGGDRAALVAFRRTAVMLCPLTTDYAYLKQALDGVDIDSAPAGETNIGDAIDKSVEALDGDVGSHKAIILISDGEDLEGKALAAAEKAGERHIPIFTVGIGDPKGSKIPGKDDGKAGFMKHNGSDVITKLDNDALCAIAKKTGGAYIPLETASMRGDVTLGTLYRDYLAKLAEHDLEETLQRRYIERYQYFLFPAVLLLLAGACLSRGRLARRKPDQQIPPPLPARSQIKKAMASRTAGVVLMLLVTCLHSSADTNENARVVSSTNAQASAKTVAPELVVPEGRDGARLAQRLYLEGRYDDAAKAYMEALKTAGEKSRRDFRYNAGIALFKAGKYREAAELMQDVMQADKENNTDSSMGLGACLFKEADSQKEQTADELAQKEQLLRESGEAFKTAVRADSDDAVARRNLAVVLDAMPDAEQKAKTAKLLADYEKTSPGELADKMLLEQRQLIKDIQQSLTNDSPGRIAQLENLSRRQKENADLWIPLKGKLLNAISQQPASTNVQHQVAAINQLAEATRDSMTTASEKLKDLDPAGYNSAAASGAAVYNIWTAIVPYQLVLQEDMRRQSNAIVCAQDVIGGNEEKKKPATQDQRETEKLTGLFVNRFSASVPEGGEQQKMNNQQAAGKDQQPTINAPGITAETRQKILELADQTGQLQANAARAADKEDFAGALPDEQKSFDLLKEIEKLLPKNQNQQQQKQDKQQQDQKQQNQDEKKDQKSDKKQQPQPQKQNDKQEQKKEAQQQEKKDSTPDDVKKVLEKALQREKDHEAELRRRNQQIPPSAIDRDW